MRLWFLLIISLLSLEVRSELLGFCFSKNTQISKVRIYLQEFLLPGEKAFLRQSLNCVEVEAPSHRKGLIDKILSMKYNVTKRYQPGLRGVNPDQFSAPAARCRLEVTRIGDDHSKTRSLNLGVKNDIRETKRKLKTTSKRQLLLTSGRSGRLRVDDQELFVICNARGANNFELEFSLDSRRNSISTTLTVSRGQVINLGSVVDDLNSKDRELSIQKGIGFSKTTGKSKARYELLVK